MKYNITYKVNWKEWKMLLCLAGIHEFYGLTFAEETERIKERELYYLLPKMIKKGMVSIEGERLEIAGVYAAFMEQLKRCEQFCVLQYGEEQEKLSTIYFGEQDLWIAGNQCQKKTLEIGYGRWEKWIEELVENKWIPIYKSPCKRKMWEDANEPQGQLLFLAEKCAVKDGCVAYAIAIGEYKGECYMYRHYGEEWQSCIYHQDILLQELKQWR